MPAAPVAGIPVKLAVPSPLSVKLNPGGRENDSVLKLTGVGNPVVLNAKLPESPTVKVAVVAEANRYFAGEAPWALAKTDPARQKTVLYVTAEVVRQIAILATLVMRAASMGSAPPPCEKIQRMSAHRVKVPENNRLTMARVESNGNSIIGEGTSGRIPSNAGESVGWK